MCPREILKNRVNCGLIFIGYTLSNQPIHLFSCVSAAAASICLQLYLHAQSQQSHRNKEVTENVSELRWSGDVLQMEQRGQVHSSSNINNLET